MGPKLNNKGIYFFYDAYAWLRGHSRDDSTTVDWSWIRELKVPKKVKVNSSRFRCNLSPTTACLRCSSPIEDVLDCLRDCPHSCEAQLRIEAISWTNFHSVTCKLGFPAFLVVLVVYYSSLHYRVFGSGEIT